MCRKIDEIRARAALAEVLALPPTVTPGKRTLDPIGQPLHITIRE
jgi:hypothetical protein